MATYIYGDLRQCIATSIPAGAQPLIYTNNTLPNTLLNTIDSTNEALLRSIDYRQVTTVGEIVALATAAPSTPVVVENILVVLSAQRGDYATTNSQVVRMMKLANVTVLDGGVRNEFVVNLAANSGKIQRQS